MNKLVRYSSAEYFMPFLFCNDIFIPILDRLLQDEVNPVKYVYGSPFCEWGIGARPTFFEFKNLNFIESYLKKIKDKYNLIPAFTFTNLNAEKTLNDEYCNDLLDLAYSLDCRFIVSTDALYNHIHLRYPDAKIHSSVLLPSTKIIEGKDFDETKFYNEMLDKCEVVVLRPEYTKDNIDKLNKLLSDISRVEVLINQNCTYNCPYHRQHYNFFAEWDKCRDDLTKMSRLEYYTDSNKEEFDLCPKFNKDYRSVHLTDEETDKVLNLGIKKLKIQGRSYTFEMMFNDLYKVFFNKEKYSIYSIRNEIDRICAEMVENNKKAAFLPIW